MKPAWDQLMTEFEGADGALVADVDCTAEGESLCQRQGVRGYPTIKWGDPANLQDYDGPREFDGLSAFAKANLGPVCGPGHLDLCDAEKRKVVEAFMAMDSEELARKAEDEEAKAQQAKKEAEEIFAAETKAVQEKVQQLTKEKEERVAAAKSADLAFMRSVLTNRALEHAAAQGKEAPRPTTTPKPKPQRTAMDQVTEVAKMIKADVDHILKLRKNAAIILVVSSALAGAILARVLCPRRIRVQVEKKTS
mmetsp:Transcript_11069/g.25155  ORF Transcript_11069/g.25155 Transcript_11069/m.25155 type:complete len:251 (-) Transcript_11069:192-944(-)